MSDESESVSGKAKKLLPIAGSVSGGAAGGAIGFFIGGPIGSVAGGAAGSLLSSFATMPAAKKHKDRIEQALIDLNERLLGQEEALRILTDEQFKVIGECLLALHATVDTKKIDYIKQIVLASVDYDEYSSYESILLSRLIRDISVEEIKFLIENFSYTTININSWYNSEDESEEHLESYNKLKKQISKENGLLLLPSDTGTLVVNGLVSLGVLAPEQLSTGVHRYKFSNIAVKLIVLLTK